MKISIITVSYNSAPYIRECIDSVLMQEGIDLEYIIIDGASTDGTVEIVKSYGDRITKFVSEPDAGIYDAMNKGLAMASGDIIGMLNADDIYAHKEVLEHVLSEMAGNEIDCLFGDLVYFKDEDPDTIVRYYRAKGFRPSWFSQGKMPPHPTFFVKRHMYEQHGNFNTDLRICADYDLMVRFFVLHKARYHYLPETMVRMRTGGASTSGISSTLRINKEMLQSCRAHGVPTSMMKIYSKYFTKVFQLFQRPQLVATN